MIDFTSLISLTSNYAIPYNLGTGNIAFSGSEIYALNNNFVIFGSNIAPATSAFSIGTIGNPFNDLYLAANSFSLASNIPGASGIKMSNDGNSFTVQNGGLRSQIIYTGGLLLSGNNIGADPLFSNLPMTIGTNGLPALQILVPTTATSYLSTASTVYANDISIGNNLSARGNLYANKSFSNFKIVSTATNTTAVDIDFSKDTLVHLHAYKNGTINSVTNPLILNPINLTAGSMVEVLIFNPLPSKGVVYVNWGGVNSSFPNYQNTSGAPYILALSSVSPTQTYHFKYICTDGTLTNTFFTN